MTPYLSLSHICKTFPAARSHDPVTAVDDICLTMGAGESLGIIGPSGCGKTTLTRILLGLLPPDSGSVQVTPNIGFVPQDPYASLDPAMTVFRIIGEPLRFSGKARRWKQCTEHVRRAMSWVALDYSSYAHRLPASLSGGERQRVAIARALVLEPELIILDEPTSMLDEQAKREIIGLLTHLAEHHSRSFLMVTHDIAMSASVCQSIAVMDAGRIIETGSAQQILTAPRSELAKRLVLAATDLHGYWEAQAAITSTEKASYQ